MARKNNYVGKGREACPSHHECSAEIQESRVQPTNQQETIAEIKFGRYLSLRNAVPPICFYLNCAWKIAMTTAHQSLILERPKISRGFYLVLELFIFKILCDPVPLNPILHTWFRDSCFTCDGSPTIQGFPLIFYIGMAISPY